MELIKNLKEFSIIKYLFLAIIGSVILALSAKVKIPFWPVPMTMQTFVVLLLGVVYGWKLGLFTVSPKVTEGSVIQLLSKEEIKNKTRDPIDWNRAIENTLIKVTGLLSLYLLVERIQGAY